MNNFINTSDINSGIPIDIPIDEFKDILNESEKNINSSKSLLNKIFKFSYLLHFLENLQLRHIFYGLLFLSPFAAILIYNGQIAFVGGILLIIASFFVYTGQIFYSVFIYFVADIAWVVIAFQSGNFVGGVLVFIGMCMGILAWLKMNFGTMRKSLKW